MAGPYALHLYVREVGPDKAGQKLQGEAAGGQGVIGASGRPGGGDEFERTALIDTDSLHGAHSCPLDLLLN